MSAHSARVVPFPDGDVRGKSALAREAFVKATARLERVDRRCLDEAGDGAGQIAVGCDELVRL